MTTVKEFKDFGVIFDGNDAVSVNDNPSVLVRDVFISLVEYATVKSFAWRPLSTLPDNPKFKYEVDVLTHSWRPLLGQSKQSAYVVDAHISGDKAKGGVIPNSILGQVYEVDKRETITPNKPVFTQAIADTKSKFKSGQLVYIAQMNTLAGIVGKRYFVEQYWCGSLFQCEYVGLGIIFDNKDDAEFKCKSLLGIDTRTPKQKAVDDMIMSIPPYQRAALSEQDVLELICNGLYDAKYRKC